MSSKQPKPKTRFFISALDDAQSARMLVDRRNASRHPIGWRIRMMIFFYGMSCARYDYSLSC